MAQTANTSNSQVPVTVIGGFLGSGKTTLLNSVLNRSSGVRYAVMVNDFGDLAIDESLVRQHDGDTISFANGCVCCSLGDNLLASIDRLLERDPPPEHFLIEVSGVANPKVIADVATLHPRLRRDLIISLVDADSILARMADERLYDTVAMQLAPADLIVLNKCDLAPTDLLVKARDMLHQHYPAPLIQTVQAALPPYVLSACELVVNADQSRPVANVSADEGAGAVSQNDLNGSVHKPEEQFHRATIALPDSLRQHQLEHLLRKHQKTLIRAKGFVLDDNTPAALTGIQLSGRRIDVNPAINPAINTPVLVVIAHEPLDKFVDDLLACSPSN